MNPLLTTKLIAVICTIAALIALRAWAEAETALAWYKKEFEKAPRIPNRQPKMKTARRILYFIFKLKLA